MARHVGVVEKKKLARADETTAFHESGSPLARLDLLSTGLMAYILFAASGLTLIRSCAGWQVVDRVWAGAREEVARNESA